MPMPLTATVVKGDPVVRFLLLAVVLYVGWYALYEFVLHPMGVLDRATIDSLISWASVILTGLGVRADPGTRQCGEHPHHRRSRWASALDR
jgi:hypothetical protein